MRRPYPFDLPGYARILYYETLAYPLYRYDNDPLPPQYKRRRQRRQAAAIVVESLWNNSNSNNNDTSAPTTGSTPTRKSTAQPRPVLNVPPKGIGPIDDPNVNDVLCGRGGRINSHVGNVKFRDLILSKKKAYLAPTTKKLEKAHIAAGIVNDIRTMNPPGRFLKIEKADGKWYDVGDAKAIKKTGQALREDAPDIRPAIDADGGSSGDEKKTGVTKSDENPGTVKISTKNKGKAIPPTVSISPRGSQPHRIINEIPQLQIPTSDYRDQMSMPPPFVQQGNDNLQSQQQSPRNQQGFQTRTIPIRAPVGATQVSYPSQLYSRGQSSSSRFGLTSQKAMEFLDADNPTMQQEQWPKPPGRNPDDSAFGRSFYEPNNSRMIGDDYTVSTISGLSEPLSSIKSGRLSDLVGRQSGGSSDLMNMSVKSGMLSDVMGRQSGGSSDLMNMSVKSNFSLTDSLRLRNSVRSGSSYTKAYDLMMQASIKSGSNRSFDPMVTAALNGSIRSGFGSLTRSNSFPDNMSSDSFRPNSGGMSIGSIMDLQSVASSTNWYPGSLGSVGNQQIPDDRSFVSSGMMSSAMLSTDLDALDLASSI